MLSCLIYFYMYLHGQKKRLASRSIRFLIESLCPSAPPKPRLMIESIDTTSSYPCDTEKDAEHGNSTDSFDTFVLMIIT